MKKPLVTIIISNLNGMSLNLLSECLDSLIKPNYPNWELYVIDNNSTDSSIKYLKKRFKNKNNCYVVQNSINMYSQGLNLGAKYAKGKYLAYFNNDVALHKSYFDELINHMEHNKNLAIAQGKLLNYYDHGIIDSAGETMDKYGNPVTIGTKEKDKKQYDKIEDILSGSGSACVIRKTIFVKLGGYDPDYGIGYEDMDLALRARRLGYSIKRFPKAILYHKRASTDLADFIKIKVKWHFNKNRLTTMIKNYPPPLLASTLPITLFLYLGIIGWEWFINRNWNMGWVRLSSIFWALTNLPRILNKRAGVNRKGAKALSDRELKLFSPMPLSRIFKDFRIAK